jgi:hypothetical protein
MEAAIPMALLARDKDELLPPDVAAEVAVIGRLVVALAA